MKNSENPKAGNICTYILVMHEPGPKTQQLFQEAPEHQKTRTHIFCNVFAKQDMFPPIQYSFCRSVIHLFRNTLARISISELCPWPILI